MAATKRAAPPPRRSKAPAPPDPEPALEPEPIAVEVEPEPEETRAETVGAAAVKAAAVAAGLPEHVTLQPVAFLYNPTPNDLTPQYAGGYYPLGPGENIVPKDAADHIVGPGDSKSGTHSGIGVRRIYRDGPRATEREAIKADADRIWARHLEKNSRLSE